MASDTGDRPVAGVDYPRSTAEFLSWFRSDVDCLDYLQWLRWPDGFICPRCAGVGGWPIRDGRWCCRSCDARTSVTAGTIFDRTRMPLTVWFHACWLFATQKDGISAQGLQRSLEISSYPTAWAMLHRLRTVCVRPGRDRLSGTVEVDETYIGGEEPGLRGGRAKGKKVLVGVAVERKQPKGFGRARMVVLADATGASMREFVSENVEPGSTVVTDGLSSYFPAVRDDYVHERIVGAKSELPGVHRVASLCKRWLLGTHQGSVEAEHLAGYLNEFVFRFSRRTSRHRGLLFFRLLHLAVDHDPVRYRELVTNPEPKKKPPRPPTHLGRTPSVERPPVSRPWRSRAPIPLAELVTEKPDKRNVG
jgi:transposase-like protein